MKIMQKIIQIFIWILIDICNGKKIIKDLVDNYNKA